MREADKLCNEKFGGDMYKTVYYLIKEALHEEYYKICIEKLDERECDIVEKLY